MISIEKLQEFKNHLLDLAIRGKLVEQRLEDESAEELYAQIQEKKQKLIADGKIKKEKPLPEITDEEIPFDIPENWKWVRLTDVFDVRDGTHDTPQYVQEGYPLITGKDFYYGYFDLENTKYISKLDYEQISKRSKVDIGDILFSMIGGNIGSMIKISSNNYFEMAIKNVALFKQYDYRLNLVEYLYWFLKKQVSNLQQIAKGGAQPFVSLKMFRSYLFPLPPLEEQKRIVSKLESYLAVIDKAEELIEKKANIDEEIRNKILDLAIRGKLVEQRPEEGAAEELYAQIQEEKQKLIAEGKIKKEKPLPEIKKEDIPFDIPDNWKWGHIGDLFLHNTGKALKSSDNEGKELEYITTSNVYWGRFELDNLRAMFFKPSEIERCSVNKGDLLVCEGGDFGRAAIWNEDFSICIQNHLHKLVSIKKDITTQFYLYLFYVYKNKGYLESRGIGIQSLSTNLLHKLVVPLPPLAEQKRIVEKIEELLSL